MTTLDYVRDPREIYRRSFAMIEELDDVARFPDGLRETVVRIVHASGMPEICEDLRYSADFASRCSAVLAAGAPIFCDVESCRTAIIGRLLPPATQVRCAIASRHTEARARKNGMTRSAAQFDLEAKNIGGAIVVIGNAPTALFRLLENIDRGLPRPEAVIAFPVGFVGAAESKAELVRDPRGMAYLTLLGRRGGSAMAAAALNGMAGGLAA